MWLLGETIWRKLCGCDCVDVCQFVVCVVLVSVYPYLHVLRQIRGCRLKRSSVVILASVFGNKKK